MSRRTLESALDEYLVAASQSGDRQAMKMLVERWNGPFTRLAYQQLGDPEAAKDVVQEAWVAVLRGISGLSDPASFRPWSYRIVSNKARDWIRKERRRRRVVGSVEPPKMSADGKEGADATRDGDATSRALKGGMALLTGEQRAVLSLYYRDELSVREIGTVLGIPAGTVKSRLFNARRALRAHLVGPQGGEKGEA